MLILDFLFAFFIALILASLIAGPGRWRHPRARGGRDTGLFLFLILLPLIWAGGLWLSPMGPALNGSYWLPPLLVGLIVMLAVLSIGAASPPNPEMYQDVGPGETATLGIAAVLSVFLWLLLLAAGAAILVYYVAGASAV